MWCNIAINQSNTVVKRRRTSGRQVLSSSHNEFFAKEFNQPHRSFKSRYFKTAPPCCKTQKKNVKSSRYPLFNNKLRVEKSRVFSFPNSYFYLQISLINSIFCAYSAQQWSFLLLSFEILRGK